MTVSLPRDTPSRAMTSKVVDAYSGASPRRNHGRFSSVMETYAPIHEPSAAKHTYTQFRV